MAPKCSPSTQGSRSFPFRIRHFKSTENSRALSIKGNRSNHSRTRRSKLELFPLCAKVIFSFVWIQCCQVSWAYHYDCHRTSRGHTRVQNHPLPHGGIFLGPSLTPGFQRRSVLPIAMTSSDDSSVEDDGTEHSDSKHNLLERITRLESIVSRQEVEIYRLKRDNEDLKATAEAFAQVVRLLREAGVESDARSREDGSDSSGSSESNSARGDERPAAVTNRVVEAFDDSMIFGTAPSSVDDAADAAGAAILAAMLGGKQRMLVDVRDAELSTDLETLVQFIELAILPIAAGLEGLKSTRNRVKIVFPKVSQLLEYRRTMALAAPEVVALSTLGFDPVERRDKVVVIVAPDPDDEEGLNAMQQLLCPADSANSIQQAVVVLNYHMVPVPGLPSDFETAYHLRLLAVQYMSGVAADELMQEARELESEQSERLDESDDDDDSIAVEDNSASEAEKNKEEELEAAMNHAHEAGLNQGFTRAMVIRAYPRPWHVFVDTSPDTDADFEVAATFVEEPTSEDINMAIVECLEGSEREDEIVAQQMQKALEDGQLDRVSEMFGYVLDDNDGNDDDDDDEDFDIFEEDSV